MVTWPSSPPYPRDPRKQPTLEDDAGAHADLARDIDEARSRVGVRVQFGQRGEVRLVVERSGPPPSNGTPMEPARLRMAPATVDLTPAEVGREPTNSVARD
jgi:hypothetical protein